MSRDNKLQLSAALGLLLIAGLILAVKFYTTDKSSNTEMKESEVAQSAEPKEYTELNRQVPDFIASSFKSDLSNSSVNWSEVLSGGPPKDGIPSIDNPKFEPIASTSIDSSVEGLLIELSGEAKFYPYSILVWHEIVNDSIDGTPVAVTFCPLCGSGIAFESSVDGEVTEFGVSGLLRESNMIMYDRNSESLWQQSTGKAFAGNQKGAQLKFVPVQLATVQEARQLSPDASILTTDTGLYSQSRYEETPYGNYDEDDSRFYFEPSSIDARYPSKEIFQIVQVGDVSVAIRRKNIPTSQKISYADGLDSESMIDLTISMDDLGKITATGKEGNEYSSYFEMWFSWAVQHEDDANAIVWEPKVEQDYRLKY